jgi:hypothetical protein
LEADITPGRSTHPSRKTPENEAYSRKMKNELVSEILAVNVVFERIVTVLEKSNRGR